jgi:tetratricopeptide (TPR) repeat protein
MRTWFFLVTLFSLVITSGCNRSTDSYVARGNRLLASGKYQDASIQFRKALQKNPNSGEALYGLGLVSFNQRNFADAYSQFSQAVVAAPENIEAKVKLAEVCLALYSVIPSRPTALYDTTLKISDDLLKKNPRSFDGLRFKGFLRLYDQKPGEAIELFRQANQIKAMQPDLITGLVQAYFLDNQAQEGERLALELMRVKPEFGPIYDILYQQYQSASRGAEAENILKKKVSNNPAQADYLVQLAEHYAHAQKPSEMTEAIQRLLADPRAFPQGRLKAGDFYARLGNWAEATHQFEEGAGSSSKEKLVYQKRIVDAELAQGKTIEATRTVDAILRDNPKDAEARRVHATLRVESGKPEEVDAAIAEFTVLAKDTPNDPVLRFNFGRAWLAKQDLGRAAGEFQEAVRSKNDDIRALTALAVVNLAQDKPADALRYAQQIGSYEPGNARAKLLAVESLTALSRYNEAHIELDSLLKQLPNDPNVQVQLGFLNLAEKKYKEAEKVFQKINQAGSRPDSRAAVGLADTYSAQQKLEKAIQILSEELKRSPDSMPALNALAVTATRAQNYDQAIEAYQRLVSKKSGSAGLYARLGEVFQIKGDDAGAIRALEQAKKLSPNDSTTSFLLGVSLERTGRTDEAMTSYRRAIQLQPDNAGALNNLAYLLTERGGNLDEALGLIQRALQKVPGQPNYTDTLARIYLKKKLDESAIRTLGNLVRQNPQNPTFHYHLGEAWLQKGDKTKAKTELETALAHQPSQQDQIKIRELLRNAGA